MTTVASRVIFFLSVYMSAITDALSWRYATKKFNPTKKISDADLDELLEVLRLSPSSYGLQPWTFIIVNDPDTRTKLRAHSWDQSQITDASHMIVLCAKTSLTEHDVDTYIGEIVRTRGATREDLEPYRQMMLGPIKRLDAKAITDWNKNQVYIALGQLLTAAAIKKIDACPMEGFDAGKYDDILGLSSQGLTAAVVCVVGYRAEDDTHASMAKVRFPKDKIVKTV